MQLLRSDAASKKALLANNIALQWARKQLQDLLSTQDTQFRKTAAAQVRGGSIL
jgi:hypothetical protein